MAGKDHVRPKHCQIKQCNSEIKISIIAKLAATMHPNAQASF